MVLWCAYLWWCYDDYNAGKEDPNLRFLERNKMKKKPQITKRAFEGLVSAIARMEADDLTDLPDNEQAELDAARDWISEMQIWFDYRATKSPAFIAKLIRTALQNTLWQLLE